MVCASNLDQAYVLDYLSERLIIIPHQLLQEVSLDARKVGEEMVESRKTTVMEFTNNEGQKVKLSLDHYYGLPLKQVIYVFEGEEEIILEKNMFKRISVGGVKSSEVTLPGEYELIE